MRISKSFKGVTLKAIDGPSSRVTRLQTVEKDEESCGGICIWSDYCFHEWL
jgi:hypothetical protein